MLDLIWSIEVKDKDNKLLAKFGSPLYISFDIQRDTTKLPNSASISVCNLKGSTRQLLQQYTSIDGSDFDENYRSIVLTVARNKKNSIIFAGTITECTSMRNGADWVTQFQCGDGFFATRSSNLSLTVNPDDALVNFIEKEAKRWKLSTDIAGKPYTSSKPASFTSLTDLLDFSFPDNWFIDNETLRCYGKGEGVHKGVQVFVLGKNQIVGNPKRTKNTLFMDTVFMPELKLGQIVDVKSIYTKEYNAQWEIISISHAGDLGISSGNSASTSVLAVPPFERVEVL